MRTPSVAAVALLGLLLARAGVARADDHAAVIGREGFGSFGAQRIPDGADGILAPSFGVRRWLPEAKRPWFVPRGVIETAGFEAAFGLGLKTTHGAVDATALALSVHVGMPLALAHGDHVTFLVIPGVGTSMCAGGAVKSFTAGVGARMGAEVHLGFIGIPRLSVQGTFGAELRFEQTWQTGGASSGRFRFSTTVDGRPSDVFTSNVAALYYL